MAIKKVVTGKVRSSYVNVFKPRHNDLNGAEEYSMMILIPKEDKETVSKIKSVIKAVIEEKFGKDLPKNLRNPLKDGDNEDHLPGAAELGQEPYAGHFFLNVKSKDKPGVVDKNRDPILDSSEFVSGDYCRVSMNAFAYDQKGNRGAAFGLQNIQVVAKGEPLSGRARASDDFDRFVDDKEDAEVDPFN